jgi:uncharacterized membrane protein HdeD (DUF308 family)
LSYIKGHRIEREDHGHEERRVLKKRKVRRTIGALLVIAGGGLMWLAPEATFTSLSVAGAVLLLAGVVLEAVGIALERLDRRTRDGGH